MEKDTKKKKKAASDKENALRKAGNIAKARRSVWYVLRIVLIIVAVMLLAYTAFIEAMYISNTYIMVTEGMALRADCIINDGSIDTLTDHFTELQIEGDNELYGTKYDAFHVESYNYDIEIESLKVLPWSNTATYTVVESVSQIIAKPYDSGTTRPVPEWTTVRYKVTLEKFSGKWVITSLTVLEYNPELEPNNTPDYSELED